MEGTRRDLNEKLEQILFRNAKKKHGGEKIPSEAWFLQSENQKVREYLTQALNQTRGKHKLFASKAAQLIVTQYEEKINLMALEASNLSENVEIRQTLNDLSKVKDDTPTIANLKVFKSQSNKGPVTVEIKTHEGIKLLEEGDCVSLEVDYKGQAELVLKAYYEGSADLLGVENLYYGSALEDIHYLSAVKRSKFETRITRKKGNYSLVVDLALSLSKKDKEELLLTHLNQSEIKRNEAKDFEVFYEELLKALCIVEEDGLFYSTIQQDQKPSRMCESCNLL